ncbi:MAG: SocA family protein [Acidobacteria bacterium]|nr:SocA family protein [Acidobacteriota bacterium]
MDKQTMKLTLRPRWITGLVENVREYFRRETGVDYSRDAIEHSLEQWLETRFDDLLEGLGEVITSPHLAEAQEFRRILEANAAASAQSAGTPVKSESPAAEDGIEVSPIFSGKRSFDAARLGSMVAYLVEKGHDIYKTNLNKLLFYSDMTAYFLRGQGISGATYVNMPFGPVPDHIEAVIDALIASGDIARLDVPEIGKNAVRFEPSGSGKASLQLTEEDRRVLDWVLGTYGDMGAGELSELSHRERAYRDTRPLEPIAYEYAKFLRKLPTSDETEH